MGAVDGLLGADDGPGAESSTLEYGWNPSALSGSGSLSVVVSTVKDVDDRCEGPGEEL